MALTLTRPTFASLLPGGADAYPAYVASLLPGGADAYPAYVCIAVAGWR
ncbi:hypothetical protein ACOTXO_02720 [Enterobacter cloacae complex sp. CDL006]|nr:MULTISPECIES: hypothetical protein [Enterobacter]AWF29185.1 hypothetical protein CSC19_4575 [Enterobacter hormaechei]EKG3231326.1 hypothetical protein [Enterobacter hormaechei]EKK5429994.1 hypothetical protein [Enterobacter hormaechei]EKK5499531.1 hypothetical protein [Enterobacter hormaechei]EKS6627094.1 hypothetical protein [Enterobacter hormaechei]